MSRNYLSLKKHTLVITHSRKRKRISIIAPAISYYYTSSREALRNERHRSVRGFDNRDERNTVNEKGRDKASRNRSNYDTDTDRGNFKKKKNRENDHDDYEAGFSIASIRNNSDDNDTRDKFSRGIVRLSKTKSNEIDPFRRGGGSGQKSLSSSSYREKTFRDKLSSLASSNTFKEKREGTRKISRELYTEKKRNLGNNNSNLPKVISDIYKTSDKQRFNSYGDIASSHSSKDTDSTITADSSKFKLYQYNAIGEDKNKRLDHFLRERTGLPITKILVSIRKKDVKLYQADETKLEHKSPSLNAYRIQPDDVVSIRCPELKYNAVVLKQPTRDRTPLSEEKIQEIRNWIIYKDEDILVINKPSGLAVQGGSKIYESVDGFLHALQYDYQDIPRLVHRLDKATSGALILARTKSAATRLSLMFSENKLEKMYTAVVTNFIPRCLSKRTIKVPVAITGEPPQERVICLKDGYDDEDMIINKAQEAISEYKVIAGTGGYSLLWLYPLTGRKHQLRVHCASVLNAPILGDVKYCDTSKILPHLKKLQSQTTRNPSHSFNPMHLHLSKIAIRDWKLFNALGKVAKKKDIEVHVPLPDYFQKTTMMLFGIDADNDEFLARYGNNK
ncbi:3630_t:CDS:10 [Ambispora gerdemannii]|uniref:21S rRNA pseudouridine(2819) synthase n=1 Tax=Ambispora gerdemannii TaxID=144530 RepID=A0A9N9BH83_9GLOM|nr:3630_t:CDS:10 [Ambispora gerdemannii]